MISIKELNKDNLDGFIQYLTIHLSENGQNETALFQPLSKQQSTLSNEWKAKFEDGMNKKNDEIGWRKVWVAVNEESNIVGHIDIRSQNQLNTEHRVLLGMGVDSNFRNLKIGHKLLEFIINYCRDNHKISWIDLQVLTNNIPATKLYEKMNFEQLSLTKDMYRIDNISYDYTSMTLNVET
ncbi:acetyltransferase (GNAT) family protein [Flavobacterium sp. 1]|uniref:GNAT family N-acetyltransferase n=1 Tax=Flavobacterium sp. 1 TaxID=2035200 RepID=UPI000C242C50|nr:GNAT family N-acetyltransferase [Flavobacterium sp. 1]PJJ10824.1 acetyltransferase (GNAT) family protein [Flavobacterium sp. 1]